MGRLRRFEANRYIGTRDTMRVYDCDHPDQFAALEERTTADDLTARKLIQTFAPDTLPEAQNRGFRPYRDR